jgi:hypothetical protein
VYSFVYIGFYPAHTLAYVHRIDIESSCVYSASGETSSSVNVVDMGMKQMDFLPKQALPCFAQHALNLA